MVAQRPAPRPVPVVEVVITDRAQLEGLPQGLVKLALSESELKPVMDFEEFRRALQQ